MKNRASIGLFPAPSRMRESGGPPLPRPGRLYLQSHVTAGCSEAFCRGFSLAPADPSRQPVIGTRGKRLLLLPSESLPPQACRLTVHHDGIRVEASAPPGFQYAGTTLGRLFEACGDQLPAMIIEDRPVFPVRGVMLDISRDKVPSMDTLLNLVDRLASWKINHLQLYTEHTFAYAGHEKIWRDASPLTGDELEKLDDYCAMLNIELTPNQNSFGHLHRWLRHPDYIHLAEAPGGFTTPWGEHRDGPFSLNPLLPESLEFLAGLYDQLLPRLKSRLFNIGGDETFDLGQGASREACEKLGRGRVYLNFLKQIRRLVEDRGHRMLFWADIVLHYPELVSELDGGVTALVWGYEAGHPFASQCDAMQDSGIPFWVCPGTSTWNSIAGRLDNMLANIDEAARAGRTRGAEGILTTEWGDNGHWQTLPFSLAGLAAGAFAGWCGTSPEPDELAAQLPFGPAVLALGNLYKTAGFKKENASPLFHLIRFRDADRALLDWTRERLDAAQERLREIAAALPAGAGAGSDELYRREIDLAVRMLDHGIRRGRWLLDGRPAAGAPGLLADMEEIQGVFRTLWLARNREGGLNDSIEPLMMRAAEYRSAGAE